MSSLLLSEIYYRPWGDEQGNAEFLGFTNTTDHANDLTGVKVVAAVGFTFPPGVV